MAEIQPGSRTAEVQFEPRRLRLARTFRGFTFEELGDKVSASRQFVHQLESGKRSPAPDMTAALAAALLVESDFFTRPVANDIPHDECNFRSLASSRVRDLEQVISHGILLEELLESLEEDLEFPEVNFPRIPVDDLEEVEVCAARSRTFWGLGLSDPIASIIRVAENAGAIVIKFPGVASEIDALSIYRRRPMIIRSSDKESPTRVRFDVAHEIGHLVMHGGGSSSERGELEDQANRFASAFLLPREAFVREFPVGRRLDWQGMFALKRRWGVSAQAILRRAYDLELIDAAQYRSGQVFISKQGYRRHEPYEPAQAESPEVMRSALEVLQGIEGSRPRDVAKRLGIQPVLLGRLLGFDLPDLGEIDSQSVIRLNERMEWSRIKWL